MIESAEYCPQTTVLTRHRNPPLSRILVQPSVVKGPLTQKYCALPTTRSKRSIHNPWPCFFFSACQWLSGSSRFSKQRNRYILSGALSSPDVRQSFCIFVLCAFFRQLSQGLLWAGIFSRRTKLCFSCAASQFDGWSGSSRTHKVWGHKQLWSRVWGHGSSSCTRRDGSGSHGKIVALADPPRKVSWTPQWILDPDTRATHALLADDRLGFAHDALLSVPLLFHWHFRVSEVLQW